MKLILLTALALCAFAGNSILCRLALESGAIDPSSFTLMRLLSGAVTLLVILTIRNRAQTAIDSEGAGVNVAGWNSVGSWSAALLLFSYAIFFSAAYAFLETGTGALVLFASVQITMIVKSIVDGESLNAMEWLGATTAFIGFIMLVLPGVNTPSFLGFSLMTIAGASWGFYTLAGKQSANAIADTTFNFVKALPFAIITFLFWPLESHWSGPGLVFACLSGAFASGVGYAIWYAVLPQLKAVQAAVVQLTVPFIAAAGGVFYLGEGLTPRLLFSALIVTIGICLVVSGKAKNTGRPG